MTKKKKPSRAVSPEVIARGCKECGRWGLFAGAVYQESGELCSAESCPNVIDEPTQGNGYGFNGVGFYDESDALNEKSDA